MKNEKRQAFYPGKVWLDTEGKRIQAHGGSVMYIDGVYYWYGENKEKTDGVNGIWHWGVRCYKSTNLYNWEDCGITAGAGKSEVFAASDKMYGSTAYYL